MRKQAQYGDREWEGGIVFSERPQFQLPVRFEKSEMDVDCKVAAVAVFLLCARRIERGH